MLQKIRDNTQGLLSKIFLGFVIAVFALFGIESIVGTLLNPVASLSVNGEDISDVEIQSLTQSKIQEYIASLGDNPDFSGLDEMALREQAIDELIQRRLLLQLAADTGMVVSSGSIDRRIAQTSDFQVDGVFSNERANLLLRNMGYTVGSYRAALSQDALINQTVAAFTATGFVTPAEIDRIAELTGQKRSFRYLSISMQSQSEGIEVSEDEIAAYYEDNQDQFMREEQVQIDYVELNKLAMQDEIEVSEEQVVARYEEQRALFQQQTERRAAHILLEASSEEEFTTAQSLAEDLKARVDAGEDFAALAAEFSDDTGSAENGGDVGYTTGSNFVEPFEAALRALAVGEVSEPVRTEFGIHLIKLLEQSESEYESLDERRLELEAELKAEAVETLFLERSDELGNLAFESVGLDEPASIMGLEKHSSDWFGRSGGTGITALQGVRDAAFNTDILEERLNSDLIRLDDNRSVVLTVTDHRLPEVLPLEEVEAEIEALLRLERVREQVRSIGETITTSLQEGQDIEGLLGAQDLSWTQVDDAVRTAPAVNPELSNLVFTMQAPEGDSPRRAGFQLSSGQYAVVELQQVTPGSREDVPEEELDSIANFISQQYAAGDFIALMNGIESRAKIKGRAEVSDTVDDLGF